VCVLRTARYHCCLFGPLPSIAFVSHCSVSYRLSSFSRNWVQIWRIVKIQLLLHQGMCWTALQGVARCSRWGPAKALPCRMRRPARRSYPTLSSSQSISTRCKNATSLSSNASPSRTITRAARWYTRCICGMCTFFSATSLWLMQIVLTYRYRGLSR